MPQEQCQEVLQGVVHLENIYSIKVPTLFVGLFSNNCHIINRIIPQCQGFMWKNLRASSKMCISDTKDNSCTAVNCVSVPRFPQKSEIYYRQYTAMHKYKMFNGSQWKSIYFIPFVSISSVVCPIRIISEVKNTTVEDLNSHILRSHTDDVR